MSEQMDTDAACNGDRPEKFTDHMFELTRLFGRVARMNSCWGRLVFKGASECVAFVHGHSDHNGLIEPWYRDKDGSAAMAFTGVSKKHFVHWMARAAILILKTQTNIARACWWDQTKFHPESAENEMNSLDGVFIRYVLISPQVMARRACILIPTHHHYHRKNASNQNVSIGRRGRSQGRWLYLMSPKSIKADHHQRKWQCEYLPYSSS